LILIYCEKRKGIWFGVAFDGKQKILASSFSVKGKRSLLSFILNHLPFNTNFTENVRGKQLELARNVINVLEASYNGQWVKKDFDLALTNLPKFTQSVLKAVLKVPYGSVTTYSKIAKGLGKKGSMRAVANSVASNPFLLLIPCHRVIRSNGKIGGYVLGEEVKQSILRKELKESCRRMPLVWLKP
jgi:O-6-methylguanine DNA methyltransferase